MSTTDTFEYEQTSEAYKKRFLVRIVAVLAGGTFVDAWILGVIGPATGTLQEDLNMSTAQVGMLAAMTLIGIFFGSPIGGWATDRWGRKPVFIIDISLFVVASFMQFFVGTVGLLMFVRFIMGVAIGCEYSVSWPMMGEMVPAKDRGKLTSLNQVFFYGGFMLGYAFSYYLNKAGVSWHWILGASTFIAIALLLGRLGMPESAHWLWFKGRKDEARRVAYKYMLNGKEDIEELERLEIEKREQKAEVPAVKFRDIFGPNLWRTTVFFTVFWIANTLPFFGIGTFAERVVAQYGLSGGIAGGVGINMIALIGVTFAMLTVDKIGRRPLAAPPMWIILAVFLVITFWTGAPSLVVLILFFIFAFMNAVGGALNVVYPAEIFPAEVRGASIGFATAMSRIAAAAGTFLMPVGIERWGMTPVMLALSAVVLVGTIATQLWAPETKGISLAQLADAKR